MICFTLVSGSLTTISSSGDRVVSGRAVAPVKFVELFRGATPHSTGTLVC